MKYLAKLSFFVMMLFAGFAVAACGDDDPVTPPVTPPGGGEGGGGDEGGGEEGGDKASFSDPYLGWGASLTNVVAAHGEDPVKVWEDEDDANITYAGYYGDSKPIETYIYGFDQGVLFNSYVDMLSANAGGFENILSTLSSRYPYSQYNEDYDIYLFASEDMKTYIETAEVEDQGDKWIYVDYYDYEYLQAKYGSAARTIVQNTKNARMKKLGTNFHFMNNNFVQKAPAAKVSSKLKGFKKFKF